LNRIAIVAAVIMLGIYISTLYKPCPLIFHLLSVNHAVRSNANKICGKKFTNQIVNVFFKAFLKDGLVRIVWKLAKGLSRMCTSGVITPCILVNPITTVYNIG
jgi:hypothetical protein